MGKTDTANFIHNNGVIEPPTNKHRERTLATHKRIKKILFTWLFLGIILAFVGCPLLGKQNAQTQKLLQIIDSLQLKQVNETGELIPKPLPKPQDIVFEIP